jgi:muconolactone delta-isomerase
MEYLVTMTTRVPDGTPEEAVQDIRRRQDWVVAAP